MSKVAVVFWSATGNTETMANCVAEGANGTIVPCGEMNAAKLAEFDAVAFGCPAMGAEQLEESEFEPMFSDLEGSLNGKKIAAQFNTEIRSFEDLAVRLLWLGRRPVDARLGRACTG